MQSHLPRPAGRANETKGVGGWIGAVLTKEPPDMAKKARHRDHERAKRDAGKSRHRPMNRDRHEDNMPMDQLPKR